MIRPYRIGVTGHRSVGSQTTVQFVTQTFHELLIQAQREHPTGVVALSGLAEGSDTLFAEAAMALGIPLEAVIAYEKFEEDFPPSVARQHYYHLLKYCQVVHQLSFQQRSDNAYLMAGHWLVDHSDFVLAVWNGQPAAGKGGTADIVAYARQVRRAVVHIDPAKQTTKLLEPGKEDTYDPF